MKWTTPLALALLLLGCKQESEVERAKKELERAAKELEQAKEEAKKAAGEAAEAAGAPKDLGDAMQKMQEAMGKAGANVDPVSYKKLKVLLPEKGGIFERKKTSGEKAAAMGMKISHASGKYEGKDGARATLKITDAGTMKGFAAGMASWAMIEIERESDEGFERTFDYRGHKAHEKFTNQGMRGEMHVFVANRFIVEVKGEKADMKELKKLLEALDVDGLAKMKDEGVKEE